MLKNDEEHKKKKCIIVIGRKDFGFRSLSSSLGRGIIIYSAVAMNFTTIGFLHSLVFELGVQKH